MLPDVDPDTFYIVQGLVSLVATLLVLYYMNKTWENIKSLGQAMRRITILSFAVLLLYASQEQWFQSAPVESRNWVALGVMILLTITMSISIYEILRKETSGE